MATRMDGKNEVSIAQLFGEVKKYFKNGEFSQAQKSANKSKFSQYSEKS